MKTSQPPAEVHIASVIVQARPDQATALFDYVERTPLLERHADSPEGKQVITLEGSHYKELLDHIDTIGNLPGVLSCNLVYHEVMSAGEADQEMIPLERQADHEEAQP